jgi:hypothetical protein
MSMPTVALEQTSVLTRGDDLAASAVSVSSSWPAMSIHSDRRQSTSPRPSLMLAEGMDVPSVAAVLGHASPAVTMSVYAHAVGRSVARATEQLAAAIGEW